MMARSGKKRQRWTSEEDTKLFECKISNPNLSWEGIAKRAKLEKNGKSCRQRWNNHLTLDVRRGEFSQEEDDTIIDLQTLHGNRWATIAKNPLLRGRTDNAIKNRWNNHLKKPVTSTHQNILDPQLFHLNQNLPDASLVPTPISASQEITNPNPEAFLEFPLDDELAWIGGFGPNVNPNETNFGGDYFEPWDFWTGNWSL